MSHHPLFRVCSPAKVNLGLEVLGKREDGYHELRTVLAMIDLCDHIDLTPLDGVERSRVYGIPDVPDESNLITRAIDAFNDATGSDGRWEIQVSKRIPSPGGLGGASSNAASTLLALNRAQEDALSPADLKAVASLLGSDVPFFLGEPAALASGTGTDLSPLPAPRGWVLIATPRMMLDAKTSMLYGRLTPGDFTVGESVDAIAEALSDGAPPPPELLANAFERPLTEVFPTALELRKDMEKAGIWPVALTGAGPTHYALFPDEPSANEARYRLEALTKIELEVFVAPFRPSPIHIQTVDR